MRFVIDRSKWLRGEGGIASSLLRGSDGKMCCLGQCAAQVGFKNRDLLNRRGLYDLDGLPEMLSQDAKWTKDCYDVNDEREINDHTRENRLAQIASDAGHYFIFVDTTAEAEALRAT